MSKYPLSDGNLFTASNGIELVGLQGSWITPAKGDGLRCEEPRTVRPTSEGVVDYEEIIKNLSREFPEVQSKIHDQRTLDLIYLLIEPFSQGPDGPIDIATQVTVKRISDFALKELMGKDAPQEVEDALIAEGKAQEILNSALSVYDRQARSDFKEMEAVREPRLKQPKLDLSVPGLLP